MQPVRRFKERLANNELAPLFCIARSPHPLWVEMFGLAGGYAGFWLDQEHDHVNTREMLSLALTALLNRRKKVKSCWAKSKFASIS